MIDGYPEEIELKTISEWPIPTNNDYSDLMEYIKDIWNYSDCGYWSQEGLTYYLSTAGWSGNEELITAMKKNMMFWACCWFSSERGGHYIFKLMKKND